MRRRRANEFRKVIVNCKTHGIIEHLISEETETPIEACCAASIIGVSPASIRTGKAGTSSLVKFRLSDTPKAPIRCILENVIAFRDARKEIGELV